VGIGRKYEKTILPRVGEQTVRPASTSFNRNAPLKHQTREKV
jgi:hypothetical protein